MSDLIKYIPDILKPFKEIIELTEAENPEFDFLINRLKEVHDNQFVETAKESGVKKIEEMLHLPTRITEALEDRKYRILLKYNQSTIYTERQLILLLNQLLGGDDGYFFEIDNENYTIKIRITLTSKKMIDEATSTLKAMIPANMILDIDLRYNQHYILEKFKHIDMEVYTHEQLRSDPI